MNNIIVTVKCGHCEHEQSIGEEIDSNEQLSFLKIDFKDGSVSYICNKCEKMNIMHLNSNAQINSGRRLPFIKRG